LETERHKQGLLKATFSLWVNWAFPFVALSALTLIAPYVSKHAYPLLMYIFSVVIILIIRYYRKNQAAYCFKIPHIVSIIMMWSATLFVIFNIFSFLNVSTAPNGQPYNPEIPWLPVLVVPPVGIAVCRWFLKVRRSSFCADCEARFGQTVERGYLAALFTKEAKFQLQCLYYICIGLTVVAWLYYFTLYKNVNLNSSDMYFFTYVPTAIYAMSLVYMGIRYHGYYIYYLVSGELQNDNESEKTTVRYLIIAGESLLLRLPDVEKDVADDMPFMDTPVIEDMRYRENVNQIEASNIFSDKTGIQGADVRFLYRSADNNAVANVFHFAVFLKNKNDVGSGMNSGEWLDFNKIQLLHKTRLLSKMLEAELYRIHTTVMAWKTYTRTGKRLYEIKNYTPTFRLSDMKQWNVDYNDPVWLFVSMNNEDKCFFKLRKLWRKIITGIGI